MRCSSGRKRSYCCLCGTNCKLDIELHHLEDDLDLPGLNEIDNALPVCNHCHAESYNQKVWKYTEGDPTLPL